MADAATDTAFSPDISSIVGGDKALIDDLTKVQREKVSEESKAVRGVEGGMARDQARVDKAFKAEGIGPEELKPWDADKEHRRFETNPLEGFGSAGGLFAVIASAFTNAPMQIAIQGMAGAMNSIKEGNEEAYTRAYDSYKENQKLALERHKLQHEEYQDALSLMDHNMVAGQAKLRLLATKYGDQQTLTLLEHGMNDEVFKLQESRAKSAETLLGLQDKLTESTLRKQVYDSGVEGLPKTGNPQVDTAHKLALYNRVYGVKETPQQALLGQYMLEHPDAKSEEIAEFADKHGIIRQYGTTGGRGALTNDRQINMDADQHKQRMRQEHPEWNEDDLDSDRDEYVRNRKMATNPPSATRVDDLRGKIDQVDNITTDIDKQLDFLTKFKGGAGVMGKIMRGEEIASNIVGAGTQSDRVEFRRRVHELEEMVPRILVDANGRPLASAQAHVADIVAGLNAGDTGPNTIRAYRELMEEMRKRGSDYRGRLEGGYDPEKSSSGAPEGSHAPASSAPTSARDPNWYKNYPAVQ